MFKLLILLVVLVSVLCKDLIRFPLDKKDNREFVAGILARGMKGIRSTVKLGKEGSVVINDYENSQYYGQGNSSYNHQTHHIIITIITII